MQLSLLSLEFLGLSLAAAVVLAVLAGTARQLAFLVANGVFLGVLLLEPLGVVSTVLFCLLGYGLARLVQRQPRLLAPCLVGFIALFVYLRKYVFLSWVLPEDWLGHALSTIGLSYLFFKIVHVMIEAQSGTLGRFEFLTYLNYCLAFTTFMSGPIQRYQDFDRQWHGDESAIAPTFEAHLDAVLRILLGLVKAYVIGDRLAPLALPAADELQRMTSGALLVNVYAYYLFLYFNFSGYCDVVIGVGSLLGVRPPENFNYPFLARNVSEYWSRWHMSLTGWLTSYVFSPIYKGWLSQRALAAHPLLGMNVALMVTLVVCGLWHGTTLGFLLFGVAHGTYLVVFRTWEAAAGRLLGKARLRQVRRNPLTQVAGIVLTFNLVAFTLILFRLEAGQAWQMLLDLGDPYRSGDITVSGLLRRALEGL